MKFFHLLFLSVFGASRLSTIAQQASPDPEDHFAGVNARGDQGMGFSHEKTIHHFHLFTDGGSIEIASNDAADADSQKAIRDHLSMIEQRFSQGDFSIPMFIHATIPPGIETMKRFSKKISYLVQNTAQGAEIRITTDDPDAIQAIHDFLKFQIEDHRTGDPLEVQKIGAARPLLPSGLNARPARDDASPSGESWIQRVTRSSTSNLPQSA
jgi:hypothetical protein